MWSYVWNRNRLLQRVVFNKRWQRQLTRIYAQQGQKLTNRTYSTWSNRSSRNYFRSSTTSHKIALPRVHKFEKRQFQTKTALSRFQSHQKQRSKALSFINVTLCIGLSGFLVRKGLEDIKLDVPTRHQVDEENGFASIKNAQFVHGSYDDIIQEFLPKFNDTDREIIKNLDLILNGCESYEKDFWSGKMVCEIGSGTGILAFPIIKKIGEEKSAGGGYIGLDISSAFVHYLDKEFEKRGLKGSRAIVGRNTPQSLSLPTTLKGKIDIFVICDTFYHLDDENATINELSSYLKRGGKLVVIESKGEEELVTKELEGCGFKLGYSLKSDKFESQFVSIYNKV